MGAVASQKIDYERELNGQQRAAVFHGEGPALVVAGAGTGKTRTLVYRVARLVEQGGDPRRILLLTFTRRAAQDMLRRAATLLNDARARNVAGGTFHSFAHTVLRRYGRYANLP
ncbi:MAG: UvrD-helicase domain-containing protein, partial [Candidatus Terrybacteria bacterium]|nr:UvrD-helicase domain-containing protein [Candidatus Terrybacteria bacterium]